MLAKQLWSSVVMERKKITGRMQVPSAVYEALVLAQCLQPCSVKKAKIPLYIISTAPRGRHG